MIHTIQLHCFVTLDIIREIEEVYTKSIEEVLQEIEKDYKVVINLKKDKIHNKYVLYLFVDVIKALNKADITEEDCREMKRVIESIEAQLLLESESSGLSTVN